MQMTIEYSDVCARKHGGHINSIEANAKVDKPLQTKRILEILATGPKTGKEIAARMGITYSRCSGRFKALRDANKITYTGQKRENSNEYRLA